jgi:hypothetical protein
MQTLTEKRVFGTKFGTTEVFVASETGLVGITVSADQIGEFGLAHRGPVHAVAADDQQVLIGTDEDLLSSVHETRPASSTAQARTFGPVAAEPFGEAVAVGCSPVGPVAADTTGAVAGLASEWSVDETNTAWTTLGQTEGVRAVDGELIAAADGVYRLSDSGLNHVGLSDVHDVAAHGTPLAATETGLFQLANGWLAVRDGAFRSVASDGHGHAHAVGLSGLLRREDPDDSSTPAANWVDDELPVDSPVVAVDYGGGIVAAVTENGTLCINAGDSWRHQPIGVRDVNGLAVGPGTAAE